MLRYEAETIKVIRGESKLSIDLLNSLVEKGKSEVAKLAEAVETAKQALDECIASADAEQQEYSKLKNWADLYDRCSFEARKMIVSQFVKAVYVYRDYTLDVEFNVSFDEFKRLEAQCEDEKKETAVYVTA